MKRLRRIAPWLAARTRPSELDRTAALCILGATIASIAMAWVSGVWDGRSQEAQAGFLAAFATADEVNLQTIYRTILPSPSPGASPTPDPFEPLRSKSQSWNPIFDKLSGGTAGNRLPGKTDVTGWAKLRSDLGDLAGQARFAALLLSVAIAALSASIPAAGRWGQRLLIVGFTVGLLGLGVGVWPTAAIFLR